MVPAVTQVEKHDKSVYFVSLGCPKNRVDTEVMLGFVERDGLRIVGSPDEAEVIVVNTCGFIGEAKEESIDTILEMGRYKEAGSCERLVVTGCLSQRYAGDLERELPEVDAFLGSSDMGEIARAVRGERRGVGVSEPRWLYDDATPRLASTARHTAYVKIAEGCDRPCGFCIIPKLRGAQRSRSPESVEREVRALGEGGAVEVNLVAQDLTTYGTDLGVTDVAINLASLLRRLGPAAEESGVRWLRLHYAYPTATTDELLDVIAGEARVAKYVDVPLQHVDDEVLKIMRRGHVGKTARRLVERVRERVPGVTLRTTFIVGHPGETDEAFARLCEFVEACEFDRVGVFTYSQEEGTHSATLDEITAPAEVAEQRRRELMRLQRRISKRRMKAMVGRELEVLVDGASEESEYLYEGRHQGQAPEVDGKVFLSLGEGMEALRPGDLVRARVDSFADYDLGATATAVIARARAARGRARLPIVVG
jgi:ribosomal protein S12 methylthiotransferase